MKKLYLLLLIVFSLSACNDWLTIVPKTSAVADNLLDNDRGIVQALNGLYLMMQYGSYDPAKYYGGANIVEGMASTWAIGTTTSLDYAYSTHDYDYDGYQEMLEKVLQAQYKVVVNCNSLINGLAKYEDNYTEYVYNLVKGEAHAIRAYVLFDLIRLFGPAPGNFNSSKEYLPYPHDNFIGEYEFLNFDVFIENVFEDLDIAEEFLGKSEPLFNYSNTELNAANGDWNKRQGHLNYYALAGLKARVHLWLGDERSALKYARIVKDAKTPDDEYQFVLGDSASIRNIDGTMFPEQVFGIHCNNFNVSYTGWSPGSSSIFLFDLSMFFDETTDIRRSMLFQYERTYMGIFAYILTKYRGFTIGTTTTSPKSFPLIRLSEMYFIIMECGTLEEANELFEEFCEMRKISFIPFANDTDRRQRLLVEYIREYIGEGQNFFTYKRFNSGTMINGNATWTPEDYEVPYPLFFDLSNN